MEKTVITWSFENWITVLLMVIIGGAVLSIVRMGLAKAMNKTAVTNG